MMMIMIMAMLMLMMLMIITTMTIIMNFKTEKHTKCKNESVFFSTHHLNGDQV